jgi:K+-sensing histidine kinase KdpD
MRSVAIHPAVARPPPDVPCQYFVKIIDSQTGSTYFRAMSPRFGGPRAGLVAASLALPPATCAVLAVVRGQLPNTDAALILVVVVVALSSGGRRASGYAAAISAAVWFDFFLTVPYYRFEITHPADVRTSLLLLLVGVAVTEIAVAARRHRSRALETAELLSLISSVATQAADLGSTQALITRVSRDVERLLGARAVRFEFGRRTNAVSRPTIEQDGRLVWRGVVWDVDSSGLPDSEIELPVRAVEPGTGRFVITPNPGRAWPLQRRLVAVVLADQVGAVLARQRTYPPLPVS